MACFLIILNDFQPLTIITKRSIFDVAVALNLSLIKIARAGHMILMLCRNALLLIELNAFETSISKIVTDGWSSYIACIACISDWQPASCRPQTCNEPTADIISSQMCDTTTILAIRRKTSPIPIDRCPGFLFNSINLRARNASIDADRFLLYKVSIWPRWTF